MLLTALLFGFAIQASATECPHVPAIPEATSEMEARQAAWTQVAQPYSVVQHAGGYDYAPFGIGHLQVENASDYFYDWQRAIVLPVWSAPNGRFYGWIRGGYVYPANGADAYPLTGAGMVETDYEHQTFIVWETGNNGWLKIRLNAEEHGDGWINSCYLGMGAAKLVYQSWTDFIREHGDWLHFRADVPHALRSGPTRDSPRITWISGDHEITLLEIKGDWMRVRVRQPAWTCIGPGKPFKGREDEGWIKWRDKKIGPWVWIFSRGC